MKILLLLLVSVTVLVAAKKTFLKSLQSSCEGNKVELENGRTNLTLRKGVDNERRRYSCDAGYVMNVKALEDNIWFDCVEKNDVWFWQNTLYTSLHPTDVKCEKRTKCLAPPTIENMEYKFLQRYRTIHSRTQPIQEYFTGDMYEYKCKTGFHQVSSQIQAVAAATESYLYDDYMDFSYNDNDVTEEGPVTCSSDGTWNDTVTDSCVAITCDATRFVNISNGNITNYKDTYNYMEYLMLSCDPMYHPIEGIDVVYCKSVLSFKLLIDFGCEARSCRLPSLPIHGYINYTSTVIGSNITFSCDNGYTLFGKQQWTCNDNEEWGESCVLCEGKGDYCRPPCVPMGATWTSDDAHFRHGSVIQFGCKQPDGIITNKINRACLTNKQWSGQSIDCIGEKDLTTVAMNLRYALSNIPLTMAEITNMTADKGRSVNVGRGVDVYMLVDISGSISNDKYEDMMKFTKALLPDLQIGLREADTHLVLYLFASKVHEIFDCQMENKNNETICTSHTTVESEIEKVDRNYYTNITGSGTALAAALTKIKVAIDTKRQMRCTGGDCGKRFNAQQVIILLSDGQRNSGGDPMDIANVLKSDRYQVEIYSIAVGEEDKGFNTMKSIASDIDQHFFAIKTDHRGLNQFIEEMYNGQNASTDCGTTDPSKTDISNASHKNLMVFAKKNAWPWMVGLYDDHDAFKCGGSLIDKQWILTAAHCFNNTTIKTVHIGQTSRAQNEHYVEYSVDKKIEHEKYDNHSNANQAFLYDIALIKLKKPVPYEGHNINNVAVLPICLFDENNMEEAYYNDLYAPEKFGVVTGWGKREKVKDSGRMEMSNELKQMQMQVKSHDDCLKDLSQKNKEKLNDTLMFCAGGTGSGLVIDSCEGDSGGPFVVRNPLKENNFIQTGIVSFGFNGECNKKGKYGVYTKLTVDLVKWIKTTIKDNAN